MATFTIYEDQRGEWRWRLVARNGRTIADSGEGYVERAVCYRACSISRPPPRSATETANHSAYV